MERFNKLASVFFAMLLVVCFVGTAVAIQGEDEPVSKPIAEVNFYPDTIVWSPTVKGYEFLLLTVFGPGGVFFEKTFSDGKAPVFERYDSCRVLFPDGSCRYELRLIPRVTDEILEILAKKRVDPCTPLSQQAKALQTAIVQTGRFTVVKGEIVVGDGEEEAKYEGGDGLQPELISNDIGHIDDVYIDGSLCLGSDCVANIDFGFDTQIFKENNLRIYFQDTSSYRSYPRNDWRIVINDSANGGGSYFSVYDAGENGNGSTQVFTLEAGAPSNALYVDDDGRVGLGTATPYVEVHMVDGDTPTVRCQQDGSSGFTPQIWDVAGNESNFFIRDVTNGSRLPFRIQPGSPSDTLTLGNAGSVGIGTWSPAGTFHVENDSGDDDDDFVVTSDGNVGIGTTSPTARMHIYKGNSGASINTAYGLGIEDNTVTGIQILTPSTTSGRVVFGSEVDNDEGIILFDHTGPSMDFWVNGSERVSIDSSGNVGIGTTTPSGKLDVNGSIYQRGGVLHADYVFEPEYALESIEEHADFMFEHKHLKAVPKARADENGIEIVEVGSHRRGILEELEKAHIYIHQLSNQNRNLEKRLAMLEALLVEKRQSPGMTGAVVK